METQPPTDAAPPGTPPTKPTKAKGQGQGRGQGKRKPMTRGRRVRRWIFRILLGLFGLILTVVVLALILLANLHWGPVKGIILSKAKNAGIDADFDHARVTLGGLNLRGIRLHAPPADRDLVPEMVTIGEIDGHWSPFSKRLDDLVIRDIVVTVVMNDDGTTSLDRWLAGFPPSAPTPDEPAKPLSQLLDALLPDGIEAHAKIEGITLRVVPRGATVLPMALERLTASADLVGGKLTLHVGPTELGLSRGDHSAAAVLDATVVVDRSSVATQLKLDLVKQTFAPELPEIKNIVDLATTVEFAAADQKVSVKLTRLSLLDGAVTAEVVADLRDDGQTIVHTATCAVDAPRLARSVPAEFGPILLEGEVLRCSAKDLELLPGLQGELTLTGKVSRLAWRDIDVRGLVLGAQVKPSGGAIAVDLTLPVENIKMPGLEVANANVKLTATRPAPGWPIEFNATIAADAVNTPGQRVRGARITASGTAASATEVTAKATVAIAQLAAAGVSARAVHLDAELDKIALAPVIFESTGRVKLKAKIGGAEQGATLQARDVALTGDLRLGGKGPAAATLTVDAGYLALPAGAQVPAGAARLELDASRIDLAPADLARSRVTAKIAARVRGVTVSGNVSGSAADASWDLIATADKAGPAQKIKLATKGRFGGVIDHDTTIEVGRVATAQGSVKGAKVRIVSRGTLRRQDAKITAALDGVVVGGKNLGSPRLDLDAKLDLDKPRVDLRLRGNHPEADLKAIVEIDKARVVRWDIDGQVAKLGALAAFLPGGPAPASPGGGAERSGAPSMTTDWDQLTLAIRGHGALGGLVARVDNGIPTPAKDPMSTARGQGWLEVDVKGVRYRGADELAADVDGFSFRADLDLTDTKHVTFDLDVAKLDAVTGGLHVGLADFEIRADATVDKQGAWRAELTARAKRIKQSAFLSYPIAGLEMGVNVSGDPQSATKLKARLHNPRGGTALELSGELDRRIAGLDAIPGRNSLTVDGKLVQTLDLLDAAPEVLKASGKLSVPFRVESGDLSMFRASAVIKLENAGVELPASQIIVAGVDGEIPILQEIVDGKPVGKGERGLYPQLRWSDQQPFLGNNDFLSIKSIQAAGGKLGPMAANVRVDHDVIALDQLEMAALGGKITGQCIVELADKDTSISFRGKVTGIKAKNSSDVLDANAALVLTPYKLGLEGRIEMVRIGKDNLYDLLDVWDPYHELLVANRVRLGLKVGYPKQVRLSFIRGFAGISVELGGIAGLVSIEEIKGVPIGPALSRFLAPVLEK